MKKYLLVLLIFTLLLGAACAKDEPVMDEQLEYLNTTLAPYDVDLSLLSDEELEILIPLLQEQKNADNFAYTEDGALSWQSGSSQNRVGGDWYSSWSNLPEPKGEVIYQALDDYSYIALVEKCTLQQAQAYADSLADLGFNSGTSSSEDFYSWYGLNDSQSISLTWQDDSLWIEYILTAE